ncbi:hypothetical protein HU200_029340 [Digitaria exilis]|uniref:Uncharacterized protein n=1 Tax=Digitaria exilis TaxID=1010633 RepID=A0A835ET91_9POAL|nr:hypothetical protein HU200_029340 [Digitaria exilis]
MDQVISEKGEFYCKNPDNCF